MQSAILLIDQGSHSTRAMLFAQDGQVLAQYSIALTLEFSLTNHVEMSIEALLASVQGVIDTIAARAKKRAIVIQKVALIVQRASFVVCQKTTKQAISPVISWMDTRHSAWLAQHQARFAKIQDITGLYANAHYALSKIRWLLDNDDKIKSYYAQHDVIFVPLAAFLAQYLTQSSRFVVDAVIASRTLLMALSTQSWHQDLLSLAGIQETDLPEIVPSDYQFGLVSLGDYQAPLTLVGGDQSFVAFSAGVDVSQHYAFVNIGSGAFVQKISSTLVDNTRLLKSPLFMGNSAFIALEGTVNSAATALDYIFSLAGEMSFDAIEQAHQEQRNIAVFHNTLTGTGSPYWLDATAPSFSFQGNQAQSVVAVIESIVFLLADNLREIQQSEKVAAIFISGGLSQSNQLCQKLADCTQLSVVRAKDIEASARGAAFFLLHITAAQAALVTTTFTPQKNAALMQRYHEAQQYYACQTGV